MAPFLALLPPLSLLLILPSFKRQPQHARRPVFEFSRTAALPIDESHLDSSISISELLESGNTPSAQDVLHRLHAEAQRDVYALAIADYVLSGQLTVQDVELLKQFASLLLDEQDELGLAAAHARSVAIYATTRPPLENHDFDEKLRAGGALLRIFACMSTHAYPDANTAYFL